MPGPMDGQNNPNLPLRAKFPRKPYAPYNGPWDAVWTEDENGRWVKMKTQRLTAPRLKRALRRFQGPWKTRRFSQRGEPIELWSRA
jgi:hypothetical protein